MDAIYLTVNFLSKLTALFFVKIDYSYMSTPTNFYHLTSILFYLTFNEWRHSYSNDNKHDGNQMIIHMSWSHQMFRIFSIVCPILFHRFFFSFHTIFFLDKIHLAGHFQLGGWEKNVKNSYISPYTSKHCVKFYL